MPKRTVSPLCGSMLATMMESGRVPIRLAPASEPTSMTLTRSVPAHGSAPSPGPTAPSGRRLSKTLPMSWCWIAAYRTACAAGAMTSTAAKAVKTSIASLGRPLTRSGRLSRAVVTMPQTQTRATRTMTGMAAVRLDRLTPTEITDEASPRVMTTPRRTRSPRAKAPTMTCATRRRVRSRPRPGTTVLAAVRV